ncbi:MAG: Gfo/Idh/MocA family oxidoreductase [Spirochaetales bacterium]|nr:Gfo/Idh/MocA family oxidoreductase [Spirochaetales bacterium]
MEPYRVAFIGLGRIASLLEDDPRREKPASHAGAFAARPDCAIAGGFDSEADRTAAFAERWDAPGFDSSEGLISAARPDILVVATHPDSHERYVTQAVGAGVPVVVCEKPLAHSVASARRIAGLERSASTRIVVNHERRFSRDYLAVREAVASERFGALVTVTARLFFGRTARHDRVFLHDGTHLVDAVHYLTEDRIVLRRRVGRYRSAVSSVFLHGRLEDRNVPVLLEVGAERDYLHLELTLSFEAGEIRVGNGICEWRRSRPSPFYSGYRSLRDLRVQVPEPTGYFAGMAAEAVRLRIDPSAESRSSASDGLAAMAVIRRAGLLW